MNKKGVDGVVVSSLECVVGGGLRDDLFVELVEYRGGKERISL